MEEKADRYASGSSMDEEGWPTKESLILHTLGTFMTIVAGIIIVFLVRCWLRTHSQLQEHQKDENGKVTISIGMQIKTTPYMSIIDSKASFKA